MNPSAAKAGPSVGAPNVFRDRRRLALAACATALTALIAGWLSVDSIAPPATTGALVVPAHAALPPAAAQQAMAGNEPRIVTGSLARILRERDSLTREFLLGEWAAQLAPAELPAALDELDSMPEGTSLPARLELLRRWGAIDGPAAMEAATQFGGSLGYRTAVLESWIPRDAESAFRWVDARPSLGGMTGSSHYLPFMQILLSAGRLEEARAFLGRIPADQAKFPTSLVATAWGRQDPAAALHWAESLAPGKLRDEAIQQALNGATDLDPELAVQFALAQSDPAARAQGGQSAVSAWARRDPLAALAWTVRQPRDETFDRVRTALVRSIGTSRPELFGSLLEGFSTPESRSLALQTLGSHLAHADPALACDRLLKLSLPDDLTGVLSSAVRAWQKTDPAAAAAFIENDPRLTSGQRSQLRKALAASPRR